MVAVVSVVVLLIFVVPQFTQMFEESARPCPWRADRRRRWRVLPGLVVGADWRQPGLVCHVQASDGRPGQPLSLDERFLALPLIGDLVAKIEMARFSRTLGTLLDNGCLCCLRCPSSRKP